MLLQQIPSSLVEIPPLGILALNLALALVLGQILGWHFVRFAQVLSNKRKLARVLMFIASTTLLIITVVGSSLALSLGLVGALSIIRFRTPVKEPEELAYLFLAIALGVGLGANRPYETVLVFVVLLIAMALRTGMPGGKSPLRTVLQVDAVGQENQGEALELLLPAVSSQCQRVELRRVDCREGEFHASLLVELPAVADLKGLIDAVGQALPGASISLVERDSLE
ncbi:MAG: hypothetical protein ACI8UD_003873 [Planctomycetota bacterium]|jgi:hypothetical protein